MKRIAIFAFAAALSLSGAASAHGHGRSMSFVPFNTIASGAGQGKLKFEATQTPTSGSGGGKAIITYETHEGRDGAMGRDDRRDHERFRWERHHRHAFEHWKREHRRLVVKGNGDAPLEPLLPTYLPPPADPSTVL